MVFKIRSLDVVHSFFVPEFSEKIDAVPGITTTLRVTPTRVGTYPAECTELCGAGHSLMRATVYVVPPATFQSWLSSRSANAAPPIGVPPPSANQAGVPGATSSAAAPSAKSAAPAGASASGAGAGKAVFTGSAGCASCHTLAAAGATGTIGPDLDTRLRKDCATAASKRIRGPTVQKCINTAITSPYKYIPSGFQAGIMPSTFSHTLTSTQIQSLVTFLSSAAK